MRSLRLMRSLRRIRQVERLEARILFAADATVSEMPADATCFHGPQISADDQYVGDSIFDDRSAELMYDRDGNAFFVDGLPPADPMMADLDDLDGFPQPMAADGDGDLTVPIYHSNPAAEKKIYLDFDGGMVTNTSWNFNNNNNPIHARAYSIDNDIFSFSTEERTRIFDVWERVSEDYSPFNVDVTTEDPGVPFFQAGGKGIRVLISTNIDDSRLGGTDFEWFAASGGVGYVESWNWRSDTPVWVFSDLLGNGAKKIAEAAAHEVGHSLGLSHDGLKSGTGYFEGHGDWAPIMGNGYHREITQFSKGEYNDANNVENDLAIITNKIDYRVDDHNNNPNPFSDPTQLESSEGILSGSGIIERADDVDAFWFSVGPFASAVRLTVEPWHNSPNLNIQTRLHADSGTILVESNPAGTLNSEIDIVLQPGNYFLAVTGVGEGDPSTDGYSQYASLGQYTIEGTIEGYRGDVNGDLSVDATDIDTLQFAIVTGSTDPIFDLNSDGAVSRLDVDELVYNLFQSNYGDANLDGYVDASDFNIWNVNKFTAGAGWALGDFTGDFMVDVSDLNIWSANRFTTGPAAAAAPLFEAPVLSERIGRTPRAALSGVAERNSVEQIARRDATEPNERTPNVVARPIESLSRLVTLKGTDNGKSVLKKTGGEDTWSGCVSIRADRQHREYALRRATSALPSGGTHIDSEATLASTELARAIRVVDAVFDRFHEWST